MSDTQPLSEHGQWGSRFAFIMAATGAAVGLGNIWKFPYMAGENGGGVFVLLYLLCLFLVGVPVMIAEVSLGKLGRKNPIDTLAYLATRYGHTLSWRWVGGLGVLALLMILGFYSAIAGWSLAYIGRSMSGAFAGSSPAEIQLLWNNFLASPGTLLLWHSLFMTMTLYVVARGVKQGIELASKWMMPGLFLMLLFLVGYSAIYGDFAQTVHFLLEPDFSKISSRMVLAAMGQALFTLAVGAGAMLVYGAYLPKETPIGGTICIVAFLDGLVALLAGFAIFPLVFSYGLSPAGGPDLMFKVLPIAFGEMAAGQLIGSCFFLLLLFAAWTSSISMAEPLVILLIEKCKLRRGVAALFVGLASGSIGIVTLLSFNLWSDVSLGGWGIFDWLTNIPTNIFLPLGALAFAILAGWKVSRGDLQRVTQMSNEAFKIWHFLIRYIAPIAIICIFVAGLL